VTEREAPPDWGFGYVQDDRYEADRAPAPPTRRLSAPTVTTWTVNGQLRAPNISSLTLRPPSRPWYRTKQATFALIAAAAAAVAVPVVMLVLRSSPATGPGESTSVAPRASTSAQPTPSTAAPIPTNAPPPLPPPPPPPPPPTEDTGSGDSQPYWTHPASPPAGKPDIGVTPTPVTRTPISVAPVPRQPPENNLATPGHGHKGWGPW
jgi:hypothetical protein